MSFIYDKNKIEEFSDLLSLLISDLSNCKKDDLTRLKIENDLFKMRPLAESFGGIIYDKFKMLEKKLKNYTMCPTFFDDIYLLLIDLKNQLWEL